jgi:hypothetical protein
VVGRALPVLLRCPLIVIRHVRLEARLAKMSSILAKIIARFENRKNSVDGKKFISRRVVELTILKNTR